MSTPQGTGAVVEGHHAKPLPGGVHSSTQSTLERWSSGSPRVVETTASTQMPAELFHSLWSDLMSVTCPRPLEAIRTSMASSFSPSSAKQPEQLWSLSPGAQFLIS